MQFRPCIDIHNGRVKQIIGSSLNETDNKQTIENFISYKDAAYYANLYKNLEISGGHVIILNSAQSNYYQASLTQAYNALNTYPGGLQAGGGINSENAENFLKAGASHIIITSYVFKDGVINYPNLKKLNAAVGKEKIVLDLSCRKKNDCYYIVTDRWQKFTDVALNLESLSELETYCDEFLIHAVDVEGKSSGIEEDLVKILGNYDGNQITYAGGVHNFSDLEKLKLLGKNRLNVTIGSALKIFGGTMEITDILKYCKSTQ